VEVPDVVGQGEDEAEAALEDAGFEVRTRDQETSETDAGQVTAQDPKGGTRRSEGATVTITVAREPQEEAVPDVTGSTLEEALAELQEAGFDVDPSEVDVDDPAQVGVVQSQDPEAGGEARRGSTVEITIGRAPAEDPAAPQDDVTGEGGEVAPPDADAPAAPDGTGG
jgi:serine/threonine-protein kinase